MVAYAVGFSLLTIVRYAAFEARALDMGNLNQAIWNTAHGNWFHLTNQPGTVNRLSLHVEPILLPIALLYRLAPIPQTLLVLQAVIVALGALPLAALARHKLGSPWAGLAFGLVFLLNPSIQAANWLEFHPVTLVPTFILAAFYFLVVGRIGWFACFAVLAASCKEEIGLLVFMLGAYAALVLGRHRAGVITMCLSLGWSLWAVLGMQHLFADGNIHWGRYDYLGDSPAGMVQGLLTRPDVVWAQLQAADAVGYLLRLLWPTAFLALFDPLVALLALPSLAINLLADFPPMHEVHRLIYAAPVVPFILAAGVTGAGRVRAWVAQRRPHWNATITLTVALLPLGMTVVDQVRHGYLPGMGNYLHLTVSDHHRRAASILAQIPPDAAVSAQDRLNPHVSGRTTVMIFPRVEEEIDTVWVDVTGPAWPQHPVDLAASLRDLLDRNFGIAAAEDGYLLLRRGEANRTFAPAFYDAWRRPTAQPGPGPQLTFGDALRLIDVQVGVDRYGELVTTLTWVATRPLETDYGVYIAYLAAEGGVQHDSTYYPPVAMLWYPTRLWESDVPVQMQTLPWTLDAERFVLAVGVYQGESWSAGTRLPVVSEPPLPLLEGGSLARLGGYVRDGRGWQPVDPIGPPPEITLDVTFDERLRLEGATWPATAQAGAPLEWTLHWRGRDRLDFDFALFAHLLDAQDHKVAQLDWQPHDRSGQLPMQAWIPGQAVVDTQRLILPNDLPAGDYRLVVGIYDWRDGTRLPATGADAAPGDVVELGPIRVR